MKRQLALLLTVGTLTLAFPGAAGAAAPTHSEPTAEIFATSNTAIITDPDDPRLRTHLYRFEHEVRGIIAANGAEPGRSTLLDGVFWSSDLRQTTYERSREFDVDCVGADGLHQIAEVIRKQYHQESVLTFRFLPGGNPRADAVEIETPGVSAQQLHDGLLADPEARDELVGGSVTLDGELILIAPVKDLSLARKFVTGLGADWNTARVRYGAEEFVS